MPLPVNRLSPLVSLGPRVWRKPPGGFFSPAHLNVPRQLTQHLRLLRKLVLIDTQ
jgi:hypothetical protein